MDIADSVGAFLGSIDWSLLWPVIGAFVALLIVLQLRSFAAATAAWWTVHRDKDLRIGGVYRFSTLSGHKIGVLTRWDFRFCRFRFADHTARVPNTTLAHGPLQIVRIDPSEDAEPRGQETVE